MEIGSVDLPYYLVCCYLRFSISSRKSPFNIASYLWTLRDASAIAWQQNEEKSIPVGGLPRVLEIHPGLRDGITRSHADYAAVL